jgi:hypothetical protein
MVAGNIQIFHIQNPHYSLEMYKACPVIYQFNIKKNKGSFKGEL